MAHVSFSAHARVTAHIAVSDTSYLLTLEAPSVARAITPGQFILLRCWEGVMPLLNRPFGACRKDIARGTFTILYKVRGPATRLMTRLTKGDRVAVTGPLGKGFDLAAARDAETLLLCAGGIGVGPIAFLSRQLRAKYPSKDMAVFCGARTKKELFLQKDLEKIGAKIIVATDDGSRGYKGLISDCMLGWCKDRKNKFSSSMAFACGPRLMSKSFITVSDALGVPAQLLLEEHFACGVGACYGCAVKVKRAHAVEYARICHDGPVFWADTLILE